MRILLFCVWLTAAAWSQPGFDYRITATPEGRLTRIRIALSNGSPQRQTIELPAGLPLVPTAGPGPVVYLCQPLSLAIGPGQKKDAAAMAVPAASGAYVPAEPGAVLPAVKLVAEEAAKGPESWLQLALAIEDDPAANPALRQRLQQLHPRAQVALTRAEGRQAFRRRDYRSAVERLTPAIAADPDLIDLRMRSESYQRLGQYQAAHDDAEQALRLAPGDEEALVRRAYARIYLKRLPEALADLETLVSRNPRHSRAYRYRAYVREQLGQGGAAEDYDRSLQLNPFDAPTYHFRSMFRERQQDLAGALRDAEQAVLLDERNSGYLGWRGHVRAISGDVAGALPDLRRALELNPNNAQARQDLERWGGSR